MKNAVVCLLVAIVVAIAGSAEALTSFSDAVDFGPKGNKITNSVKYRNVNFSFNGITDQFTNGSSPTLELMMPKSARKFVNKLFMQVGSEYVYLGDVSRKANTFTFTGDKLELLNQAIKDDSVTFRLAYRKGGKSVLKAAALTGTLAPEPASMALVAAGLVAIPFARRLRKSFTPMA